ncbi:MAG: hypothetical protein D6B25_20650 [Desulfobulbaceae bacterium]|nr:MAG: hypothetical protein D6B25_20650 [Desulfobulbaceae bacterium]
MCTVSWVRHLAGYDLFFNRDESRQRLTATPPEICEIRGGRAIRPIDTDAGGTWIWVNSYGLTACLLNNYQAYGSIPTVPVSRGVFLTSFINSRDVEEIRGALWEQSLADYYPFLLLGVDNQSELLAVWDGRELSITSPHTVASPICSSGFAPEEIIPYRQKLYQEMVGKAGEPSAQLLQAFHEQHDANKPAHSVLMSRTDAQTVSMSRVMVKTDTITFQYRPVSESGRLLNSTEVSIDRG